MPKIAFFTQKWHFPPRDKEPPISYEELGIDYWLRWGGGPLDLPAWMLPREVEELTILASDEHLPRGDIVEVGSGWGGTAFALAKANESRPQPRERVITIDNFDPEGLTFHEQAQLKIRIEQVAWVASRFERAELWRGTSDLMAIDGPAPYVRLAVIDGDHTTEWVWRDVRNIAPFVVAGGLIVLHDTHETSPDGPNEIWKAARAPKGCQIGDVVLRPYKEALAGTLAFLQVQR